MIEDKARYKDGDKFDCKVEISYADCDDDEYNLYVVGVGELEHAYSEKELDSMFDPTYKERMKQLRIKELEEELTNLKGEDE